MNKRGFITCKTEFGQIIESLDPMQLVMIVPN